MSFGVLLQWYFDFTADHIVRNASTFDTDPSSRFRFILALPPPPSLERWKPFQTQAATILSYPPPPTGRQSPNSRRRASGQWRRGHRRLPGPPRSPPPPPRRIAPTTAGRGARGRRGGGPEGRPATRLHGEMIKS